MYEFSITGSLVVERGLPRPRGLAPRPALARRRSSSDPVLLTLGLAITVLYTESAQLVPALQSPWLVIHVSVAFISSALFTSLLGHVLQLVQERREKARAAGTPPLARPVHGPAAAVGRPRGARLPAGGAVVPAVDVHARRRRDLGREGLGPVLGLGPQGGLDLRHLGGLRRVPARPRHPRAGTAAAPPTWRSPGSSACCSTSAWSTSSSPASTPTPASADPPTAAGR